MGFEKEFIDAIETVCKKIINRYSTITIGKAVNIRDGVCDVDRNGAPKLLDVRLNALEEIGESYATIVPVENSFVLCGVIENTKEDAVVLTCSEVQKIIWKVGEMQLDVTADGIVMNGGDNGGIPIVAKVTDRLNLLEKDLNDLKTIFSSWTPVSNDGGAALKGLPTMQKWFGGQLTETEVSQIENPKITH